MVGAQKLHHSTLHAQQLISRAFKQASPPPESIIPTGPQLEVRLDGDTVNLRQHQTAQSLDLLLGGAIHD